MIITELIGSYGWKRMKIKESDKKKIVVNSYDDDINDEEI